jgi:hypothetical protein
MKTLILICIGILLLSSVYCSKGNEQDEAINLAGTWGIIDLTYNTPDGTQKVMEAEIKNGSAITDFYFMSDYKFKQTSNMAGNGKLDTYEGTWKVTGNKLIITLNFEGRLIDVDYTCEMKNDLLILTRTSPDGKMSIINTFKRK